MQISSTLLFTFSHSCFSSSVNSSLAETFSHIANLPIPVGLNTVKGISWYAHKETPGLGARIEEDKWRDQWKGVHAYNDQGEVATGVTKAGQPKPNENWVDGISGATLTSAGVKNLIQFWLGDRGYKPFLDNLRSGTPNNTANAQTSTTAGEEA